MIPSEEQGDFDFENGTEFEFIFEIGEAPEVKLELSAKDKMTYYTIKVDKKMHDDYRSNFLRRFGRLVDTDKVTADEALEVTLDNGDMKIEGAYVGLISMNEEERKPFIGKKVGFKTQVNVNELYKTPAQRAAVLQVKENELEGIKPEFSLEITKIRKFAEPELNEEFFKMAFPAGNVKTAEEFEAFVDAEISKELRRESDYLFTLQLRDFLLKKAGLTMPVEFLKRWLYVINEGKFSKEEIEKGRDAVSAALTAAHLRFRPIVMTSLAFILGLLPLVFASGPGSASRQGIGTGVFFGMLVAITVGIVFVPFFFVWIYRIKAKLKR